jgi:hypothetical protein
MVDFVRWYNHEHRHSGLAFLTPADVHYGRAYDVLAKRNAAMQQARLQHPRRFHPSGPAPYALAPKAMTTDVHYADATSPANVASLLTPPLLMTPLLSESAV